MNAQAKNLTGKVALVTGGSRGLGVAIAHALADEGADVAITCVASADMASATGGREHYHALMGLIKQQGGVYGAGVEYGYTMVHHAPQSAH